MVVHSGDGFFSESDSEVPSEGPKIAAVSVFFLFCRSLDLRASSSGGSIVR